jgi:hypothetical protein
LSSRLISKNIKIKIGKPIILPVVLYGCETGGIIVRKQASFWMLKNRVLRRRIFGPKREEVAGDWRR